MSNEKFAGKRKLLLGAALALLLLIGILIGAAVFNRPGTNDSETASSGTTETAAQIQNQTLSPEQQTSPTPESTEETEPTHETEPATEPSTAPVYTPPVVQLTTPAKTVIKLPYQIPGTTLVIQRVANYSGVYLEDGSDETVRDVAMMLLYNSGSEAVEFAEISMKYDDKTLQFIASVVPAGGYVAVQEANRSSCASGDLTECTADVATLAGLEMSADMVSVTDNGDNSMTITNLTEQKIVTVRIFYKYYLADENAYVGGITYTARLSNLEAGETIVISPTHFVSRDSVIVMVRTYDTEA